MIELEKLQEHIQKLKTRDWDKLFMVFDIMVILTPPRGCKLNCVKERFFILDTANGKGQRLRKPKLHSNADITILLFFHASLLCTSTSHPPHLKKQNIQQSNIHQTFSL